MSGHRILNDLAVAPFQAADPGDAGTFAIDRDRVAYCLTVGAAGETRTLPQPTKAGIEATVNIAYTAGGAVTLTVTGSYDGSGTTLSLDADGDWVKLISVATSASAFQWRLINGGSGASPGGGAIPGLTATVAELNVLAGVTAGTAAASKAVVLNAAGHTSAVKTAALSLGASGSETLVTATGAELNYCDVTTLGTVQASKAVTADAGGDITFPAGSNLVLATTGAGTQIGTGATQLLGFYGATAVAQPAAAGQAAVTPSTDFTGTDQVNKATVLAAVQAVETLVNQLRADLVTLGLIKGAA